jgi:hypothetical protein
MSKKLTNEDVDKRLVGTGIKRLEDYVNCDFNISFQCLICNYVWDARPQNIFSGKGCPKCAGVSRLTNEVVDQRLSLRSIKRMGNVINNRNLIEFMCTVCCYGKNGEWKTTPGHVIYGGTGCPRCSRVLPQSFTS